MDTLVTPREDVVTLPIEYGCLVVLQTNNQVINHTVVTTDSANGPLSGLPNVKSVCDEVCKRLYEFDRSAPEQKVSPHRVHPLVAYTIEVGDKFPAHALIRVDEKSTAADVTEYLNQKFSSNRNAFPRIDGWQAEMVVGGADFSEGHPFFRYRDLGRMDSKCARIIVVVDRAIEGMNNKFLLVEGIAGRIFSHRRNIQSRGRLLRSAARWKGLPFESPLIVPPCDFDRIYVITHEAFTSIDATGRKRTNAQAVVDSLTFITNMSEVMTNVMTLEQYVDEDHEVNIDPLNWRPVIDWTTAVRIAIDLGNAMLKGQKVPTPRLVAKYSPDTEMNRRYYRALIESGIAGRPMPFQYKKDGRLEVDSICLQDIVARRLVSEPPQPTDIVYEETLSSNQFSLAECRTWATAFGFTNVLTQLEAGGDQMVIAEINRMVSLLDFSHRKQELMISETPAARVQKIIDDLITDLNASDRAKKIIQELIHFGVQRLLERQNIKGMADLMEDGALCKPTITHTLRQTNLETELRGWVVFELLQRKEIDTLAAVLTLRNKS